MRKVRAMNAQGKCQCCATTHDIRRVTLINGSNLDLCAFHRRLHDSLISETPISQEEAEEMFP